jgi:chromosome segregation ATPase
VLTRHIERLEKELEVIGTKLTAAETERDQERARAAQVDALNAVLELERKRVKEAQQRAEELRQERDRWSDAAEAFQGQLVNLTARKPRGGLLAWLRKA